MSKQRDDFLAFDPNRHNTDPWATYVPSRAGRNKFKTHRTRGSALTSLMTNKYYGMGKLYSWENGHWELEVTMDREAKNHTCDNCGGDTAKDYSSANYRRRPWNVARIEGKPDHWGDAGTWCWRRQSGRIATPVELLFVCEICYPALRR